MKILWEAGGFFDILKAMQGEKTAPSAKGSWLWKHLGLILIILLQTALYLWAGANKAYLHMDEAFSLGLTHFEQIDPASQEDFYNHWHSGEYFEDYLAVDETKKWDFRPVIQNQKDDVHPPLYYLLLRVGQNTVAGQYSKWPGIILNILIAAGNTVLVFLILGKLLEKEQHSKAKALVMTGVVALTIATVSAVVYIRMYQLLTFWILLTVWWHLCLYERTKVSWKLLVAIGGTAVAGMLTQYYYLFFLVPLWVVFVVKYVREKKWRELSWYTGALVLVGGVSLVLWPVMLKHMFFGYRGQGVVQSLLNISQVFRQIWDYILIIDYYDFHRMLILAVAMVVLLWLWRSLKIECSTIKTVEKTTWEMKIGLKFGSGMRERKSGSLWPVVIWPTMIYFLIVAAVSPYIELRYVMPVCGLIVMMVSWWLYRALTSVLNDKMSNVVMLGFLGIMLVAAPVQLAMGAMRIELLYRDKEGLMRELQANRDVPTVYFITTENNRFLDNLLPFVVMDQSYLALDRRPSELKVEQIVRGKDLSRGLYVWISDQYNHKEILDEVREATDLGEVRHVRGVNTCDVYYLSK